MPKDGSVVRLDGQGKPLWLVLELTYRCPLKCPWCSNPVDYDGCNGKELSTEEWKRVLKEADQRYLVNAYRVLLTRARQGMVVFVPPGDAGDHTRLPAYYDETFDYLVSLGVERI